jgi:hypothetical protein
MNVYLRSVNDLSLDWIYLYNYPLRKRALTPADVKPCR